MHLVECVGGGFWLQQVSLAGFEFLSAPVPKEIETTGTVFPPTITTATTSDAASADSSPTAHTDTSSKASTSGASNADSDVLVDAVHDAATVVGTNSLGWLVTDNTGGLWLFLGCGLLAGFTKGAGSGVRVLRNWNAAAAALNTSNASNNSSTTSSNNDTIGGSDARVVGLVHEFSRWLKVFYDDIG